MKDVIYSVVDTETTGLDAKYNQIIDIAVVSIKNGKIINTYETLVNPGRKIPDYITMYTGIDNNMVEDAPNFSEISYKLKDLIDRTVIVAHNALFDLRFLNQEFKRTNLVLKTDYLCTLNTCRKLYPNLERYNLDILTKHFNIQIKNRHTALGDAQATAELFLKIRKENKLIWSIANTRLVRGLNKVYK